VFSKKSLGKIITCRDDHFLNLYPQTMAMHDGIKFVYSETLTHIEGKENQLKVATVYKIVLSSDTHGVEYMQTFIEKSLKLYNAKLRSENVGNKLFVNAADSFGNFIRYPLNNTTTMDDLIFSQKHMIVSNLEKLKCGKLPKLAFLFHGKPGCGKTSVIKAIANDYNMNIIWIKLSLVRSSSDLMSIFYNDDISYCQDNIFNQTCNVSPNKRIYVFEEIDVDTDIFHDRSTKPVVNDIKIDGDKIKVVDSTHKLQLSDVLNVLDGLKELNKSIIIMTTNRPDIIDPAVTRYGRVNARIEFVELTSIQAHQLIHKYYPDSSFDIKDYQFTPAELKAHCQMSNDESELASLLSMSG